MKSVVKIIAVFVVLLGAYGNIVVAQDQNQVDPEAFIQKSKHLTEAQKDWMRKTAQAYNSNPSDDALIEYVHALVSPMIPHVSKGDLISFINDSSVRTELGLENASVDTKMQYLVDAIDVETGKPSIGTLHMTRAINTFSEDSVNEHLATLSAAVIKKEHPEITVDNKELTTVIEHGASQHGSWDSLQPGDKIHFIEPLMDSWVAKKKEETK